MKVCHLTSVHPTFDVRIFLKECVSLAQTGFQVSLVSNHDRDETVNGVRLVAVPRAKDGRLHRMLVYTWSVFLAALRTRSQIYHFHDPELFFAGAALRLLGKTVIFDVHEAVSAQIKDKEWLPCRRAVSRIFRLIDAASAKLFYLVLAEDSYAEIYRPFGPRQRVVLNLPDLAFLEPYVVPDRSANENGIFYVGDVTNARGMDTMVEALAELKRRGTPFTYHCVGPVEPSLMAELEAKESFRAVKDRIKFYGLLKLDEAYEISTKCKVGCCLLKPIDNYKRSYSTKIFEYMAVHLPVITSDFGLFRSVVEESDAGVWVDPCDPIAVADALEGLLEDDARARRLGENGRGAALRKYSWEAEKAKLVELYREIAGRN